MTIENTTPARLILKLAAYFLVLISSIVVLLLANSDALRYLPLGGTDALQRTQIEITESRLNFDSEGTAIPAPSHCELRSRAGYRTDDEAFREGTHHRHFP